MELSDAQRPVCFMHCQNSTGGTRLDIYICSAHHLWKIRSTSTLLTAMIYHATASLNIFFAALGVQFGQTCIQNPSRDKEKCKSVSLLTPDGMLASHAECGSECNKSMTVTAHQLQNDSWYLADKRFCWNRCAGEMLDDITLPTNCSRRSIRTLLLPLICGSFGCFRDAQGDTSLSLVARTSVSRFGIRHHCRGSNTEGEVANFVETEADCLC